jgi:hypothetical protein
MLIDRELMKVEMNDLSQKEFFRLGGPTSNPALLLSTARSTSVLALECKSDETKIKKPLHSGRFSTKVRF